MLRSFLSHLKPFYCIFAKFNYKIIWRKKQIWHVYVWGLSVRTHLGLVWKKIHKITGTRLVPSHALWGATGNITHDKKSIIQLYAQHLQHISSNSSPPPDIQSVKRPAQVVHLKFACGDLFTYNLPLTDLELSDALSRCSDSPGLDGLQYMFLLLQKCLRFC